MHAEFTVIQILNNWTLRGERIYGEHELEGGWVVNGWYLHIFTFLLTGMAHELELCHLRGVEEIIMGSWAWKLKTQTHQGWQSLCCLASSLRVGILREADHLGHQEVRGEIFPKDPWPHPAFYTAPQCLFQFLPGESLPLGLSKCSCPVLHLTDKRAVFLIQ